jgi:hypothetical protein
VALCLVLIVLIAFVNLRGVRESGAVFAGPMYLFILSMLALTVGGFYYYFTTGATMPTPPPETLHHDKSVATFSHDALTGGALILAADARLHRRLYGAHRRGSYLQRRADVSKAGSEKRLDDSHVDGSHYVRAHPRHWIPSI